MSANQPSTIERPRALGFTRAILLAAAFLTGLYLSESVEDDEQNEEAPAAQRSLAQVDR